MADDTATPFPSPREGGAGRGSRPQGNRDTGGFRIRLSDNEMQAARALQEAFGLRSTVAVLGFSLRTLAQQLEQGQLDELVAQHRSQAGGQGAGPRREDRRRDRPPGEQTTRGQRVDPFARPSRPAPVAAVATEPEPEPETDAEAEAESEPVGSIPVAEAGVEEAGVEDGWSGGGWSGGA